MADTFSGYEVHHNDGDFNIIHPGENGERVHLKTIEEWQEHVPRSEMDPGTARTQWKKALRTQQEGAPPSGRRSRLRFLTGVVQFHQESIGSSGGKIGLARESSAAESHSTMCSKPLRQSGQRRSTACRCALVKMAAAAPGVSELCSSWRQRASSVERWRFARKPS